MVIDASIPTEAADALAASPELRHRAVRHSVLASGCAERTGTRIHSGRRAPVPLAESER